MSDILTSGEAAALCTTLGWPIGAAGIRAAGDRGQLLVSLTPTGRRLFSRDAVSKFAIHRQLQRDARRSR